MRVPRSSALKPVEKRRCVGAVAYLRPIAEDRPLAEIASDRPEAVHAQAVAADQLQIVAALARGAQDQTGVRPVAANVEHVDARLPQPLPARPNSRCAWGV